MNITSPLGWKTCAKREWCLSGLTLALRKGAGNTSGEKEVEGRPVSQAAKKCLALFTTDLTSVFCRNCSEQQTAVIPVSRWSSNRSLSPAETNKHKPALSQSRTWPSQVGAAFCSLTPNYFNIHYIFPLSGFLVFFFPLTFWRHTKNWITFSPRTWLQPHLWGGSFRHFKGPEVCDNMALHSRILPGNRIRRFILFLIFERFQKAFNWISH